ncbi:aldo/keto reductase [Saccharopolyspora sp. K220]|uniref:aldo/keto reductase n=1 Tax=Saccharopolyspora soli TaxID=2926618 RepID=UPI001F5A089A|nr:aldo/keto reductase [Saccharopolyspora soli]MCI2420187.1 aldo/keto reductase [Saccharopolyspora soli]
MDNRRLGTTQIEISPIGLGCLQFAGRGLAAQFYSSPEAITEIVRTALDSGINWFDTAEMYGRGGSERALTTALHELGRSPGEVVIATKWSPAMRIASSIHRTIEDRVAALQGYPIDLHQIHLPHGGFSSIERQVRAMAELSRAGRIASVGVSNFSARQMERASEVLRSYGLALASNQVQISLLKRDVERNGVLATARRLGVTLIAYSPLRSGVLTGKFHDDPALVKAMPRIRRLLSGLSERALVRTAPLIDELRAIAEAHGASIGQVALSWLISFYGNTVVAIPGATKPHQAKESAAAMNLRLTDQQLTRLDELSRSGDE